jgi:hypothetical protein
MFPAFYILQVFTTRSIVIQSSELTVAGDLWKAYVTASMFPRAIPGLQMTIPWMPVLEPPERW